MKTWKYYNHALLPVTAPNECPDLSELQDKNTWNYNRNKALIADMKRIGGIASRTIVLI